MMNMQKFTPKREKGFTLIELVMVIVILGILAAFALPRFADLGTDARVSTLDGAIGSVKSAAAIAHSACLARETCDANGTSSVALEGSPVNMENGYPTAATGGIDVAAQINDDFVLGTAGSGSVLISAKASDGTALSDCSFTYNESDGSVDSRTISKC